uniref:Uncharacterized protein n=1 Tax=Anguilla anguilla TaxID=7936 RepID=A0A0E9S8P2_ANGAN
MQMINHKQIPPHKYQRMLSITCTHTT